MNKLLLLFSVAAMGISAPAAQAADGVRFVNFGKKHISEATAAARAATIANISRATAQQLWKPASVKEYYWGEDWNNPGTEQWMLNYDRTYTYNMEGNVTSYTTEYEICEYTYDNQGRCTGMFTFDNSNSEKKPYSKQLYTYDTVIKNLIVSTETYFYEDNTRWVLNNAEKTDITRNADGNITKIVESSYYSYEGAWHNSDMIEIGYGADKKANSIKQTYTGDGENEIEAWLTDIVWDRTNGQIIDFDTEESDFFLGDNRLKSAKGLKQYNYPYLADLFYNVVYKANDGGYKLTTTMDNEDIYWVDYTVTDAYGSYRSMEYEVDFDTMDDGTIERDDASLDESVLTYDAYGLLLLEEHKSYLDGNPAGELDFNSKYVGTVVYDSTHGYPLEYTQTSQYKNEAARNNKRIVYADYYDVIAAGVESVVTGDNAPVEYYTLQGIRVENPQNGIFIRRQGTKVTKVVK